MRNKTNQKMFELKCENHHKWNVLHFYESGDWFPVVDEDLECPECGEYYEEVIGSRRVNRDDFYPE